MTTQIRQTRLFPSITLVAVFCGAAMSLAAQEADPLTTAKVPVVSVVGCAASSDATRWTLTRATGAQTVETPFASTQEVDAARAMPLGSQTYTLIGTAEFVSPDELLRHAQRAEFTARASVNATAALKDGYKVLAKGLLVTEGGDRRVNLTSVTALAQSCS